MRKLRCLLFFLLLEFCLQQPAIAQKSADTAGSKYPALREAIKQEDIIWKKRVWREIKVNERNNAPMRSGQPGDLATILLSGVRSGAVNAYANDDTAFAKPLPPDALDGLTRRDATRLSENARLYLISLSKHRADHTNVDAGADSSLVYPQQVEFYEIKEDWIFDKNTGQMVVYIDALAPAAYINGEKKALYWLHYPDIRSYLEKYEVNNGSKTGALTWNEYFESRRFSSTITYVQTAFPEDGPKHSKRKKKENTVDSSSHDMWVY